MDLTTSEICKVSDIIDGHLKFGTPTSNERSTFLKYIKGDFI